MNLRTAPEMTVTTYQVPRVNLLPPEITDARRLRRVQGGLAVGFGSVLALLAGAYLVTASGVAQATSELGVAQARTAQLLAEQARYAEVPQVAASTEAAQHARETAMAMDVHWYRYLDQLARTAPADVWLGTVTATVNAPAAGAPAPVNADPLTQPGIGTVTFTGTTYEHAGVAAWLDVLGGTEGFSNPSFSEAARAELHGTDVVDFTSSVTVTTDALSGAYSRKGS